MSQKKIKHKKRMMRETQESRGWAFGKIAFIIIGVALLAFAVYFMMQRNNNENNTMEQTPLEQKQTTAENPITESLVTVVIETVKGNIRVRLYPDDAPKTVANFIALVEKKFYDGLVFHRVEPNFVIQGGDPKGDGTGGSDAAIPLEIKCKDGTMTEGKTATCEPLLPHRDGALAMARTNDPNSATSQFYITNGVQSSLDKNYAVFGYVTEGLDVVAKIQKGDVMKKVHIERL